MCRRLAWKHRLMAWYSRSPRRTARRGCGVRCSGVLTPRICSRRLLRCSWPAFRFPKPPTRSHRHSRWLAAWNDSAASMVSRWWWWTYAHTPDALEKVLQALREHTHSKLVCVFGCGGDRDRGKRPQMGRIAEQLADIVILTNDNPRHEDPVAIINEIASGMQTTPSAVPDRTQAIRVALSERARWRYCPRSRQGSRELPAGR